MLVTLEGLDGSGKTTVWNRLKETYPAAQFTREPTESWYGDAVRRSVNDDTADPLAELFLYTADHAAHLSTTIQPALAAETLVISDRYLDSRFAYQAATLAEHFADPLAYIRSIHDPFTRYPDLTLYLDIDPETAVERSSRANKFEQLDHLKQVQANYERLIAAAPERFVRIDASQSLDAVVSAAIDAIDDRRAE